MKHARDIYIFVVQCAEFFKFDCNRKSNVQFSVRASLLFHMETSQLKMMSSSSSSELKDFVILLFLTSVIVQLHNLESG